MRSSSQLRHRACWWLLGSVIACTPQPGATPPTAPQNAVQQSSAVLQSPAAQGAAVTGTYRNLFAELGIPSEDATRKISLAYQQLFHGNDQQALVFSAGQNPQGPLAYLMDIHNKDVRSEGMSYGMMVAVQLDQKADFDALWNWAKTYMYHADVKHPAHGYFSWQMRSDGTAIDEMPAPDGEEYFATALLFAEHRWGAGEGIYAYGQQAAELLTAMRHREAVTGVVNGKRTTTGVALFNSEHKMVRFTPDSGNFEKNTDHTDPSYHLPAFYEIWARFGPEQDRAFWSEAAGASRDYFVKVTHPVTGLAPDCGHFDGTPVAASWDPKTVDFRYDAWRTAMNWSVDAAWWARDRRETELSDRLLGFFSKFGKRYPNTFKLDGTATNQSSSSGLTAMNAVAALAATRPEAADFVRQLYALPIPTGQYRYYDGVLYLLAMLHVSGTFRVYAPVTE
jgi:oligosaccharide reducing-end xylanase